MDTIQIISLVWLAFIFSISLWQHINLGLIMLPASFILALFAGIPLKILYGAFPTKLVILILGVMFLWFHAQASGLAGIFVKKAVRMAGGRVYILPWIIHIITAAICAIGALPAAAFAITVPVAMEIAKREKINLTLMGIVLIQGACVGGFSIFNPWGSLVAEQVAKQGMPFDHGYYFIFQAILSFGVALVGFFAFGGLELLKRGKCSASIAGLSEESASEEAKGLTLYQGMALVAMLAFIGLVLAGYDVGFVGFALGMTLQVIFRVKSKDIIGKLPWGIAIMIAGVLMYVGLLDHLGVLGAISKMLMSLDSPAMIRLGVTYVGTIIANFESSSIAVLALVIPVAVESLVTDTSIVVNSMQMALISGSIAVMCASPFHIGGALVLAETDNYDQTFRQLLIWVVVLTFTMPLLALLL